MKNIGFVLLGILCGLFWSMQSHAFPGDMGYEGGISSGITKVQASYPYQEVVFLTGEPIVLKGTKTVKKSVKRDTTNNMDTVTSVFTYLLKNTAQKATLTRSVTYVSKIEGKANKQKIESTEMTGKPTEVIRLGDKTYTLTGYEFSKTSVTDIRPAIEFFAGDILGKKVYTLGTANAQNTAQSTVTVDLKGKVYGFNQAYTNVETIDLNHSVSGNGLKNGKIDTWSGDVNIKISLKNGTKIRYEQNEPSVISFDGGFIEETQNEGVLEFTARMPEFDSEGNATYKIIEKTGRLKESSFPTFNRLQIDRVSNLKGHWAETDVRELMAVNIIKNDVNSYTPDELIKRSEFADMLVKAAKEIPIDPAYKSVQKRTTTTGTKAVKTQSFLDVGPENPYYQSIEDGYKRELYSGRGDKSFYPDDYIVLADAIKMMIKAIGIEEAFAWPGNVSNFRDNDSIPSYARNAFKVAQKIKLIRGDEKGFVRPLDNVTKTRAVVMINNWIKYMRVGIEKDYIEHIIDFQ